MRLAKYILDRDADQRSRQQPPYWYKNSIQYSARAFHMTKVQFRLKLLNAELSLFLAEAALEIG